MTALPNDTPPEAEFSDSSRFSLISAPAALVATLSAVLENDVCAADASGHGSKDSMTVFHALEAPSISVSDYVFRVAKYAFCSEACLITAYHYLTLAVHRHSNLSLTSLTVHRLLITAVVLACKYLDDTSYNLSYYAKVGGLPPNELANLEIHMLRMLDFRLDVSINHFAAIENALITRVSCLSSPATVAVSPRQVAKIAVVAQTLLFEASISIPVPISPLSDDDDDAPSPTSTYYGLPSAQDSNSSPGRSALLSSPVSSEAGSDSLSRNSSSDSLSHPSVTNWSTRPTQPAAASHAAAALAASSYAARSAQPTGLLPPHGPTAVSVHRPMSGTRTWRRDVRPPQPTYNTQPMQPDVRTGSAGVPFPMRPSSMPMRAGLTSAMPLPQSTKPVPPSRRTYHVHHHIYTSQPQQTNGVTGRSRSIPSAPTHQYVQSVTQAPQAMSAASNAAPPHSGNYRYMHASGHSRLAYSQGGAHLNTEYVRQSHDAGHSTQQQSYGRRGPGSASGNSVS